MTKPLIAVSLLLPTLMPGDPAWTGKIPVEGAVLKLITPLDYDIDDTIKR